MGVSSNLMVELVENCPFNRSNILLIKKTKPRGYKIYLKLF